MCVAVATRLQQALASLGMDGDDDTLSPGPGDAAAAPAGTPCASGVVAQSWTPQNYRSPGDTLQCSQAEANARLLGAFRDMIETHNDPLQFWNTMLPTHDDRATYVELLLGDLLPACPDVEYVLTKRLAKVSVDSYAESSPAWVHLAMLGWQEGCAAKGAPEASVCERICEI